MCVLYGLVALMLLLLRPGESNDASRQDESECANYLGFDGGRNDKQECVSLTVYDWYTRHLKECVGGVVVVWSQSRSRLGSGIISYDHRATRLVAGGVRVSLSLARLAPAVHPKAHHRKH